MPLKFTKPPLDEVVISIYFEPIKGFQTQHAGLFWSKISKEFPNCESIDAVGDPILYDDEPVPVPRYRFISDDGLSVVQIQRNGFMTNWRPLNTSGSYPHYEEIKNAFVHQFNIFKEFLSRELGESVSEVESLNFGYMNFINTGDNDGYKAATAFLPSLSGADGLHEFGSIVGFGRNFGVEISDNMSVRFSVQAATRGIDSAKGTRFELRSIGIPENADSESIIAWLDASHSVLEKMFIGLTSDYAHQQWGIVTDVEAH